MSIALPATVVWDLDGCQQNFEQIAADGIGLAEIATGTNRTDLLTALGIGCGSSALTFSASNSASVSISHGLNGTPRAVVGTLLAVGSLADSAILSATSVGSTGFIMSGFVTQGAITGTVDFSWVAIL